MFTTAPGRPQRQRAHTWGTSAQEIEVRAGPGVSERLLDVFLRDQQYAFGVFGREGDAAVAVHQRAHGVHQFARAIRAVAAQIITDQGAVRAGCVGQQMNKGQRALPLIEITADLVAVCTFVADEVEKVATTGNP
jgi:hypothetical protein